MGTRPKADNPKGKNITINVTDDLRKRVDKLQKAHFSGLPMNLFTGYLVEVGLEREELRFKKEEVRNKVELEQAAMPEIDGPVFDPRGAGPKSLFTDKKETAPLFTKDPAPSYGPEIKVVQPREFDNNVSSISYDIVYTPFYGQTAAGKPINFDTPPGLVVPWAKEMIKGDPSRYFTVLIRGNSMTEAGIEDGDYALLRRAEAPRPNRIMLIRHGDESTLKRIKMKGDQEVYMCWEDGTDKEPVRLDDQDYEIQGEYMGILRGKSG